MLDLQKLKDLFGSTALCIDTMHWTQPKTFGSIPPPCRAHSSTLVDNKRLYVFGGGDGPQYFNELYMLDTGATCFDSTRILMAANNSAYSVA